MPPILNPFLTIYFAIHVTVLISWSSVTPFRYINSTADTTPVDIITIFSFKRYVIYNPNFFDRGWILAVLFISVSFYYARLAFMYEFRNIGSLIYT
jgi:hypothetical protein